MSLLYAQVNFLPLARVGPACGLDTLRADLDRSIFFLGSSDGERLSGPVPARCAAAGR